MADLSAGVLADIKYSPETGIFTWARSRPGVSAGSQAGCLSKHGYLLVKVGRKQYRAHRLAWLITHGEWPDAEIDHINGDRADNRICNLRPVDRSGNSQNRWKAHCNSSHGRLGAAWNKQHQRWQSKIAANGARHHLGYFNSADEAHVAYMNAKRCLHISGGGSH
jgi:hypothetical protein